MPRTYRLGRRAELKAETRARIVAAAVEVLRTGPPGAFTTPAVARAADVAPGTVRNHFPAIEDLVAAVADAALVELRLPDASLFSGVDDPIERVGRLAHAFAAFFRRSEGWWQVFSADPMFAAASAGASRRYFEEFERLVGEALGPFGGDGTARIVVGTVIGTPTFVGLLGRGLTHEEAVAIGLELIEPWLRARFA